MNKKLIALVSAGAIILSLAAPVFGLGFNFQGNQNVAMVSNSAVSNAHTGWNIQGNGATGPGVSVSGDNTMVTGDAVAGAEAVVIANTHVGCCGQPQPCCVSDYCCPQADYALVENGAVAVADTGSNLQGNVAMGTPVQASYPTVSGDNVLVTGNASAWSRAWTVVNTHLREE